MRWQWVGLVCVAAMGVTLMVFLDGAGDVLEPGVIRREALLPSSTPVQPAVESRARQAGRSSDPSLPLLDLATSTGEPSRQESDRGETLLILAETTDSEGQPLADVGVLIEGSGQLGVVSGPNGQVRMLLPWSAVAGTGGRGSLTVKFHHPEWSCTPVYRRVDCPGILDLGRVLLERGGQVEGWLLDASGQGVAGAWVHVAEATDPGSELIEASRRTKGYPFLFLGIRGSTDERGFYRIHGVPAREVSVVAGASGLDTVYSAGFPVAPGEISTAPSLILQPPTRMGIGIRGHVRDESDGIEGAVVKAFDKIGSRRIHREEARVLSDEAGEFFLPLMPDRTYWMTVQHPDRPEALRTFDPVQASPVPIEVAFGPRRWADLQILDVNSSPLDGWLTITDENKVFQNSFYEATSPGRNRFVLPDHPFGLNVYARGFESQWFGPWVPEEFPEDLSAHLHPAPLLRVRVMMDGKPCLDARLHIHSPYRGGELGLFAGGLLTPWDTRTKRRGYLPDEEGRFQFTVKVGSTYLVHAELEGRARAEIGPLQITPATLNRDWELQLVPGASLEGQVRTAPGAPAWGIGIGASRSDGHAEWTTTGEEGWYRFDHLAPGAYQVVRVPSPNKRRNNRARTAREDPKVEYQVELVAGRVSRYDLDLTHELPCTVRGHYPPAQGQGGQWSLDLTCDDATASGLVQADGTFEATVLGPGKAFLIFQRNNVFGSWWRDLVEVELLPGENEVNVDWQPGRLELSGLLQAQASPETQAPFALLQRREGEGLWWHHVTPDPSGSWSADGLPSGPTELRKAGQSRSPYPNNWELTGTFELRPGESTQYSHP